MRRFLPLLALPLFLVACVDTTGLSPDSSRGPHPSSNANAAVVVTEYGDVQCPACRAAHEVIIKPLLEKHGATIRYEFHHFPLRSIHRYALVAAMASECAADQGKFWEYLDKAYTDQPTLTEKRLGEWATELGLDRTLFDRCLASEIKEDVVIADYNQGRALGVQGTPTFFVNGERVESDLKAIEAAITAKGEALKQLL